jgi:hypothetical protein
MRLRRKKLKMKARRIADKFPARGARPPSARLFSGRRVAVNFRNTNPTSHILRSAAAATNPLQERTILERATVTMWPGPA